MIRRFHEYSLYALAVFLLWFILFQNHAIAFTGVNLISAGIEIFSDRQLAVIMALIVLLASALAMRLLAHQDSESPVITGIGGAADPVQILVCGALVLFWGVGIAAVAG